MCVIHVGPYRTADEDITVFKHVSIKNGLFVSLIPIHIRKQQKGFSNCGEELIYKLGELLTSPFYASPGLYVFRDISSILRLFLKDDTAILECRIPAGTCFCIATEYIIFDSILTEALIPVRVHVHGERS